MAHTHLEARTGRVLTPTEVLAAIPHRKPFRFVDEILSIDEQSVEARCTFRDDADFYAGHFPGYPITPGVLLLECMAQAGLVALAIYLDAFNGSGPSSGVFPPLFSDADVQFCRPVPPGSCVHVSARRLLLRHGKLRCRVELRLPNGTLAARGTLAGIAAGRHKI